MSIERGRTGHVSWLRSGPEPPRLLFLHGYSDAAACWVPLLSQAEPWDALAVDARGHGESGLPEEPFGPQAMAAETAQVLDAVGAHPSWCRADHPRWPDDESLPWAIAKEELNLRLHELPWEDPVYLPDLLGRVRRPVLLLLGETSEGSVIDAATAWECAAAAVTPLEVTRLAGAGHAVSRDQRTAFLSALTAFLEAAAFGGGHT